MLERFLTVAMASVALSLSSDSFLAISLVLLVVCAFLSATHDIALDGYYMLALPKDQQAAFVGVRSTFFRVGWMFTLGGLVTLAGLSEKSGVAVVRSWQYAILVGAVVYGLVALYGWWAAPEVERERHSARATRDESRASFADAFLTFFAQPKIFTILAFIVLYRFGEAMVTKMSTPFLFDVRTVGGLGFDTLEVGSMVGYVGIGCTLAGGLSGGYLIARFGLRRMVWPMMWVMTIPNLGYVWAAHVQPGLAGAFLVTALEQLGYGFGLATYLVYLMQVSQRSGSQTSHYAICSAFMALGAMAAGITSGYLQDALGYEGFFIACCLATIPGIVALTLIPIDDDRPAG